MTEQNQPSNPDDMSTIGVSRFGDVNHQWQSRKGKFMENMFVVLEYPEGLLAYDTTWVDISNTGKKGWIEFKHILALAVEYEGEHTEVNLFKTDQVDKIFWKDTDGCLLKKG